MPRMATLRRIQDGRGHQRAEHAAVGDRERAAGQLFQRDRAVAGLLRVVAHRLLELREAQRFGITNDRHHQATLGGDGDAEVVVLVIDDVVAVDGRIHRRELAQRFDRRLDEERAEAQLHAVHLLELVLVARARVSFTAVRSTSLNVVSIAAVDCA